MTNEITTQKTAVLTREIINEFLFNCGHPVSDTQKKLFLNICMINNLNPFKYEVYAVPFYNQATTKMDIQPIVSYKVYLARAEASGKLDGYKIEIFKEKIKDGTAVKGGKITIYRKDWSNPFEYEVDFEDIVMKKKDGTVYDTRQKNAVFMTKKALIRQAMPLAFPGIINDVDEIAIDPEEQDITSDVETEVEEQSFLKHYSDVSGEEVEEKVYNFTQSKYGYTLTYGEQKEFDEIKKESPKKSNKEIFEALKAKKAEVKETPKTEEATEEDNNGLPF